jgi:hypothetical protein
MWVNLRFYVDPETDDLHIYGHNVHEDEVQDVLDAPLEG